jgi:hypothetical protein
MTLPQKIVQYFSENEEKTKEDTIKELVKKFGVKESTAITYYANKSRVKYSSQRKIAFEFFDKNPNVINQSENEEYAKKLNMSPSTYRNYKYVYKIEQQKKNQKIIKYEGTKEEYKCTHYKGRLREKFTFDDSRL